MRHCHMVMIPLGPSRRADYTAIAARRTQALDHPDTAEVLRRLAEQPGKGSYGREIVTCRPWPLE
jgi:hypothetical protein